MDGGGGTKTCVSDVDVDAFLLGIRKLGLSLNSKAAHAKEIKKEQGHGPSEEGVTGHGPNKLSKSSPSEEFVQSRAARGRCNRAMGRIPSDDPQW